MEPFQATGGTTDEGTLVLPSPVGTPRRDPAPTAERAPDLAGKTLVVLDNGQAVIELAAYGDVLDWVTADLAVLDPPPRIVTLAADLVTRESAEIARLEQEILALDPAGVVIGLCHAGVTAPSTLLAGSLERQGVPCALICTPLGEPLAGLMASYDVPDLALVPTSPVRGLSPEALAELQARVCVRTRLALTTTPRRNDRVDPAAGTTEIRVDTHGLGVAPVDRFTDVEDDLWDRLTALRLGDGLPVVMPTERRVDAMLLAGGRPESDVLLDGPTPNQAPVTVGKLAVNAVLAGCRPEYFPVLLTAVEAMAREEFRFFQTAITTHPGGIAVVVSGPLADKIGLHGGAGCLGPGSRANATIGRAVNFVVTNIARSVPGMSSLTTFGSPAQYTYCFAELRDDNPWTPLHRERFDDATTTVTVLKCESPHNVISNNGPGSEPLLRSAASVLATLGNNSIRWPGDHLVLINPAQARMLVHEGFSKHDVRMFLFDEARVPARSFSAERYEEARPRWTRTIDRIPLVREPAEYHVFVAGGLGNQMMVAPPWGLSRAVTLPVKEPS